MSDYEGFDYYLLPQDAKDKLAEFLGRDLDKDVIAKSEDILAAHAEIERLRQQVSADGPLQSLITMLREQLAGWETIRESYYHLEKLLAERDKRIEELGEEAGYWKDKALGMAARFAEIGGEDE